MNQKIKKLAKKVEKLPEDQQRLVKEYYKDKPWTVVGEQRSLFKNCSDFPLFSQPEEEKQLGLF